ncbi:protein of unknown function (DUF4808) [Popillia japonica]|uniref:Fibronectin type III domain-containing protein n=1 Tax=Popillia japonica TaxID=7064 RepID=A0AAW1JE57_POPJA
MEVEIREESDTRTQQDTTVLVNNTPAYPLEDEPELIVRAEEILLVVLVLMIWVAAITMFFNRWGQIRTLEPYQPKFQQNHHRTSCPLVPLSPPHITPQQRMSFSKYNVNCFSDAHTGLTSPATLPPHRRPRQNSVFVSGSSAMAVINTPPRRVKSAIDIQHLIVNEKYRKLSLSGGPSLLPIISSYKERKPSIVIERLGNSKHPLYNTRRRPSMAVLDRPMLSHYHYPHIHRGIEKRRVSLIVDIRTLSVSTNRSESCR